MRSIDPSPASVRSVISSTVQATGDQRLGQRDR